MTQLKNATDQGCRQQQGTVCNGMEDDFSVFHTGNFLPFHTSTRVEASHAKVT